MWWGGVLPFYTLDYVRTIFFKFLVLEGVWHKRGRILKSVEHFWGNIWAFRFKIHPKIDTFAKIAKISTRDLTILEVKKVVLWTF